MVQHDIVWYSMVLYGMVWYGMVWYGIVSYRIVSYGVVWCGMWHGVAQNVMLLYSTILANGNRGCVRGILDDMH
jgi:hypothetical protein